ATISTLASFNGADGANPANGVVEDRSGNLFGTTEFGGASNQGTVFEIPAGSRMVTTLASFNGLNGAAPLASLVMDGGGNLVGTTLVGGAFNAGTVFEIAAGSGTITPLVLFNGPNGAYPGALLMDGSGNLFGTTSGGGGGTYGSVFEIAAGSGV